MTAGRAKAKDFAALPRSIITGLGHRSKASQRLWYRWSHASLTALNFERKTNVIR